jgi:hypothetical protein
MGVVVTLAAVELRTGGGPPHMTSAGLGSSIVAQRRRYIAEMGVGADERRIIRSDD